MDAGNSSNVTNTDGCVPYNRPRSIDVVFWVWLVFFAVSIIGNGLIILVLAVVKQARSPTNRFILNLTISDFLMTLSTAFVVLDIAKSGEKYGTIGCKVQVFTMSVFYGVSILSLVAVAFERYYAVCKPLKFTNFKRKVKVLISVIWVASILLCSPMLWACIAKRDTECSQLSCNCYSQWPKYYYLAYGLFLVFSLYLLPIVVLLGTSIPIAKHLWSKGHFNHTSAQLRNKQTKRITTMMSAITVLFVVSWTPYNILYVLKRFQVDFRSIYGVVWYGALLLAFLHCCINPIIYLTYNKTLRNALEKMWCGHDIDRYQARIGVRNSRELAKSSKIPREKFSISSESRLEIPTDMATSFSSSTFLSENRTL